MRAADVGFAGARATPWMVVATAAVVVAAGACAGDGGAATRCAKARTSLAEDWRQALDGFEEAAQKIDLTWNKLPPQVREDLDVSAQLQTIRQRCHGGRAADCAAYSNAVDHLLQRYLISKDFAERLAATAGSPDAQEAHDAAMREANMRFQNLITMGVLLADLAGRETALHEICPAGK